MSPLARLWRALLCVALLVAPMHADAGMFFDPGGTGKLRPSLRQGLRVPVTIAAQPAVLQVFQRQATTGGTFGKGQNTAVPVGVSVAAPVASTDYRLRDANSPATVLKDWASASGALPAGTSTLSLTVPAGAYQYLVDVRSNGDNTTIGSTTNKFGVGRVVAFAGQSEIVRFFGRMDGQTTTLASLGITPSPLGSVYASYDDTSGSYAVNGWQLPADDASGPHYNSSGVASFLRDQIASSGVVCAVIGYGHGATASASWLPGQANNTTLSNVLSAAGGAWEGVVWYQGASDAAAGVSKATYQANLTTIFNDVGSKNSYGGTVTKLVAQEQPLNSNSFGSFQQVLQIRAAQIAWTAANSAIFVAQTDVDTLPSGTEISMEGYVGMARHVHRAFLPSLGGAATGDAGPTLGTSTTSGTTVTIPITQAGGTTLVGTGSWQNRFTVYDRGTTNALTVSGGSLSATAITLTMSAAPAGQVDAIYDTTPNGFASGTAPNNSTAMVRDDYTADGGVGRSLTANAILPSVNRNITLASPTYDTTTQKFGSAALNGGTGTIAAAAIPQTAPFSLGSWVKTSAAGTATKAAWGAGNFAWFGVGTTGQITGAVGSSGGGFTVTTATKNIVDNAWHWAEIDVTYNATNNNYPFTVYVDGTSVATGTATAINFTPTFGVMQFGTNGGNTVWTNGGASEIDDLAFFSGARGGAVPSAAFTGSETGIVGLWHLDSSGGSAL